jgi:succinate dehydrogenase / fumarate reductase, cytochrome b subunit
MHRNPSRPMSPHLTIWKWGPHMAVSILHRVTGTGLATLGAALFVWWLVALASGPEAYAGFAAWIGALAGAGFTVEKDAWEWIKYAFWAAIGIGLTWAFFQHMLSGIRHFVMDIGAGYELRTNRLWAVMTLVGALLLTALAWGAMILGRMAA